MSITQDTLTLEFRAPITLGKDAAAVTYASVELREPTGGELEKAARADTNIGVVITLVSLIGQVPRLVAEKMSGRDLDQASKFFATFQAGHETAAAGQN